MTLNDLFIDYPDANAVKIFDRGNGAGLAEEGEMVPWSNDMAAAYGHIEMTKVDDHYTSDWIIDGTGDNPHRVRLEF